jgi:glycosyltransferase involved in cell wall biosynthesis
MKIVFIGTYPPQKCGIATFTHNLIKSTADNFGYNSFLPNLSVIAVKDQFHDYNYPHEVILEINRNDQREYISAAKFINYNKFDVCIIQHEFGIFGGESGVFILSLISRIKIPLIVTFHTVIKEPTEIQKTIVQEISKKAFKIVVMSTRAVNFLRNIYDIPGNKIELIEHGVPVSKIFRSDAVREKFNFGNNIVLFTFGLLSRNKGIETVINALPKIVERYKNILYIVLGKTHPGVLHHYGEEYREYLKRLVKEKNLEKYVYFYKRFVSEKQLMEYLHAIDFYITPYLNEAQITSGTLSYAIGAGAAVISTPYWHAQELLADGRGRIFDFNNHEQLENILLDLLDNSQKVEAMRETAFEYGQKLKWPKCGAKYLKIINEAINNYTFLHSEKQTSLDPLLLPDLNLDHIKKLTDSTGIIQHAKYGIPNFKEGYCLDDNARGLLMAAMAFRAGKCPEMVDLMHIFLSFIHYMQNDNGTFRNLLSYNRNYLDETGSEDSFGRTIWALGYTICYSPKDSSHRMSMDIFNNAVPNFSKLVEIRGIANTILGLCYYLRFFFENTDLKNLLNELSYKLINEYKKNNLDGWNWFENILTYDNAIIPLSLYHSYEILNDKEILNTASQSAKFLEKATMTNGYFKPVGNKGWFPKNGKLAGFGQQSIDVMGMVLLYFKIYQVTKQKPNLEKMLNTYMWYLGKNDINTPVYDFKSGGCHDGLEEYGLNKNKGAESSLAYLISHLTVLNAFEHEHEYD